MWIKVRHNQNSFTVLEIADYSVIIFEEKKYKFRFIFYLFQNEGSHNMGLI